MQVPQGCEGNTRDEHSWAAEFLSCTSAGTSILLKTLLWFLRTPAGLWDTFPWPAPGEEKFCSSQVQFQTITADSPAPSELSHLDIVSSLNDQHSPGGAQNTTHCWDRHASSPQAVGLSPLSLPRGNSAPPCSQRQRNCLCSVCLG